MPTASAPVHMESKNQGTIHQQQQQQQQPRRTGEYTYSAPQFVYGLRLHTDDVPGIKLEPPSEKELKSYESCLCGV